MRSATWSAWLSPSQYDAHLREHLPHAAKRLAEADAAARAERERYRELCKTIDQWMTEEEFKKVRGCLKSERVPPELQKRFDEAYVIFDCLKLHSGITRRGEPQPPKGW